MLPDFSAHALIDEDLFGYLGERLRSIGYTAEGFARYLGMPDPMGAFDPVFLAARCDKDASFEWAVRLWLLGETMIDEAVVGVCGGDLLSGLSNVGWLLEVDGTWKATVQLRPLGSWVLAADFPGSPARSDHVVAPGKASQTLAALVPRKKVEKALDMGCGAGIQSLVCRGHVDTLVGSDLNARSLWLAEANRCLNKLPPIDWRPGSFFEPVGDETFDLIVSNPPFVISPEHQFQFRDGGLRGDEVSALVLREAAAHLAPGGRAVMLVNWHHSTEEDWASRPLEWLHEIEASGWLLGFHTEEARCYAETWLPSMGLTHEEERRAALDRWMAYYDELGARWMTAGVIVLERNDPRRRWIQSDRVPGGQHAGSCGQQIDRVLRNRDQLAGLKSREELLKYTLKLAPGYQAETVLTLGKKGWEQSGFNLRSQSGLAFEGLVGSDEMQLIPLLAGRPLKEALALMSDQQSIRKPADRAVLLDLVYALANRGILEII